MRLMTVRNRTTSSDILDGFHGLWDQEMATGRSHRDGKAGDGAGRRESMKYNDAGESGKPSHAQATPEYG